MLKAKGLVTRVTGVKMVFFAASCLAFLLMMALNTCTARFISVGEHFSETTVVKTGTCDGVSSAASDLNCDNNEEETPCADSNNHCSNFGASMCIENFQRLRTMCPKACKLCANTNQTHVTNVYSEVPQKIATAADVSAAFQDYIWSVNDYMYERVYHSSNDILFVPIRQHCRNKDEMCTAWALFGECAKNPSYMELNCGPACFACERFSVDPSCPFDWTEPVVWSQPGDLHDMFTRIATSPEFQQAYQVTILSEPNETDRSMGAPWVLELHDFLNETECQVLQELGRLRGYSRSMVESNDMPDSGDTSPDRTSSHTWCDNYLGCSQNQTVQTILARLETVLKVPQVNYEGMQLLQYKQGEFYKLHHDYIDYHSTRHYGHRIATVFIYLGDVEEGGATRFPLLNDMTITPKCGKTLIWPSVLDVNPLAKDMRMDHEALPVIAGTKYAANVWVHQRDFQTSTQMGCIWP